MNLEEYLQATCTKCSSHNPCTSLTINNIHRNGTNTSLAHPFLAKAFNVTEILKTGSSVKWNKQLTSEHITSTLDLGSKYKPIGILKKGNKCTVYLNQWA
uniref:Uncharacterized protein n=1 Tax=Opuntia streptacantha TaxID=393608 RepID=A0A7C9AUQ3_OPUST